MALVILKMLSFSIEMLHLLQHNLKKISFILMLKLVVKSVTLIEQ